MHACKLNLGMGKIYWKTVNYIGYNVYIIMYNVIYRDMRLSVPVRAYIVVCSAFLSSAYAAIFQEKKTETKRLRVGGRGEHILHYYMIS